MVEIIKWDQTCSVGVQEMDEAHKVLFRIGNRMIQASVEKHGDQDTREVIDEMIAYADQHFSREEQLMELAKFPERKEHHAEHEKLMSDIRLFKSRYVARDLEGAEVASFLIDWIVNHIKNNDKKYTPYMQPVGAP
jgi:hemerythrin